MANDKPVHELRIGRIKATIWENDAENGGTWHNVTLSRLYKTGDLPSDWQQSGSFGRDDLPIVAEVTMQAWRWIYQQPRSVE